MNKVHTYEAVYRDDEPGERSGGWEVVEWTVVTLDGKAKQGRKHSDYYWDEEGCKKEAWRLNKELDSSFS